MRLHIEPVSPRSIMDLERSRAYSKSLGLPTLGRAERPRLAIVGGGPSIRHHIEELKTFDGEVWAVNGAYNWLHQRGVDCTFFSCDPSPQVTAFCSGVEKAILAVDCDPSVFDAIKGRVETVDLTGLAHGPTTATTAPAIGLTRGNTEFWFYGCEGSFKETTHAYGDFALHLLLRVSCDGKEWLTSVDLMVQVEYLGEIIRSVPTCHDRSGGLLAAYIKDPAIDVLAAKPGFYQEVMDTLKKRKADGQESRTAQEDLRSARNGRDGTDEQAIPRTVAGA